MTKKTRPKPKAKRAMPIFTKAPQQLVDRFTAVMTGVPDVQQRKMFGYPAAFTNTQMFACLFGDAMILRLSDGDRTLLRAEGWKPFEPMPGRPMREYLAVPERIVASQSSLKPWIAKARAYAASLPPKTTKKR